VSLLLDAVDIDVMLGGRMVAHNATLRIARGQIVALLGPNGAGKSSLLRASLGLIAASRGRARIWGADARTMAPDLRARRVAYLPQKPEAAWPISVRALVALGRFAHGAPPERLGEEDRAAVSAAIAACDLGGLEDRRLDELSGGERARAHLARALAQGAPLLALDEPNAGLDPAQTLAMADIFVRHAGGDGAVLFSTHDVGLAARAAGHVILMRTGRVIAEGPPLEALTPAALGAAYGRSGRLIESRGAITAAFD